MIDLHSHILPGLDDGVRNLEEAVELARAAAAEGVTAIAATPHVRDDYPTTAAHMEAAVAAVREALAGAGVAIDVLTGGELAVEAAERLEAAELRRFALAGGSYLLVETPYYGWTFAFEAIVNSLAELGLRSVIAHPERNAMVQERPERLRPLLDAGALVQVTAASLDGRLGRSAARCARRLIDGQLAHLIASDAHAPAVRGGTLAAAVEAVGDPRLAAWLTREVPAAVVAGEPPPARPVSRRRRIGFPSSRVRFGNGSDG